ncbi:Uncharacterised protein [Mycobacterium tuberculosis]|nr:Uncharacterised protein [Mycobacterium tuberculosis]COZ01268.1 Uncharacterised protein [Mycobacterium tuberculosis]COZ81017.1 Uncharacterised protein [Mycobacterium tuberculosis]
MSAKYWAKARAVLFVAMTLGVRRIPVSVSTWVRISSMPSESRPYSMNERSASIVRRRITLACSTSRRRSRPAHSSCGSERSSMRNLLGPLDRCPVDANISPHGLRRTRSASHGAPRIGM